MLTAVILSLWLQLKRARVIDGSMPLVDTKPGEKPLSIAISEMNQGKMTIYLLKKRKQNLRNWKQSRQKENAEEDSLNIQEEDSEKRRRSSRRV